MTKNCSRMSLLGAALSCFGSTAFAASPPDLECKSNPNLVGPCYQVQGVLNFSADSAFVLWRDKYVRPGIVVRAAPNSDHVWPANVHRAMDRALKQNGLNRAALHGTFQVCPIPSQSPNAPDRDPWGCIQAAYHLTLRRAGQ
jgi:hypothetical protein